MYPLSFVLLSIEFYTFIQHDRTQRKYYKFQAEINASMFFNPLVLLYFKKKENDDERIHSVQSFARLITACSFNQSVVNDQQQEEYFHQGYFVIRFNEQQINCFILFFLMLLQKYFPQFFFVLLQIYYVTLLEHIALESKFSKSYITSIFLCNYFHLCYYISHWFNR